MRQLIVTPIWFRLLALTIVINSSFLVVNSQLPKAKSVRNENNDEVDTCKKGVSSGTDPVLSTTVNTSNFKDNGEHRWRMGYFEEQTDGFELLILDESLDERMANIIHTVHSVKSFNIDFFSFNSGNPETDRKNMDAVAGPQVNEIKCNQHLKEMVALLDDTSERLNRTRLNPSRESLQLDERHFRLARVLDSYGRYESGHLSGRTQTTGQFDQCVSSHLLLTNQSHGIVNCNQLERVGTRYCWARLNTEKHLNPSLKYRIRTNFEMAEDRLMMGICLPKSCHSKTFVKNRELIQKLVDSQFKLPKSLFIEESLEVNSIFCLIDQDSEYAGLPLSGKLAVIFLISWLIMTIYATTVYKPTGSSIDFVMDCLNLRKSMQEFLGDQDSLMSEAEVEKLKIQIRNRQVELDVLNPVKTFGGAFVVLGHSLVIHSAVNQNNLKSYYMIMSDPSVLLIVVGTFIVDTFFVITGMLMGYIVMKQANSTKSNMAANGYHEISRQHQTNNGEESKQIRKHEPSQLSLFVKHWLKFTINRYLLLVPILFLVFWVKKSVIITYFADRPMWDPGFNKNTAFGACKQESWLSPFTMMSAFMPLSKQCLPQTWSVSTDLFFSLTLPPVILLMPRKPKLALTVGIVIILISNILTTYAYISIDSDKMLALNTVTTEGFALMFGSIHHLYTYPHFRFCSVLIGLLAGYYLYKYGSGEMEKWPDWFKGTATKYAIVNLILIFYGYSMTPKVKYYFPTQQQFIFANIFTTFRMIWATCNAIVLTRMASDWRKSYVMQLFANRFWQSLVKLNYAILLVHMEVLLYVTSATASMTYFTKQKMLADFGATYFYCIPLATFLHVVYENPIRKLVKQHVLPSIDRLIS